MTTKPITTCPGCNKRSSEDYDGAGVCWTCSGVQDGAGRDGEAGARLRLLDVRRMLSEPPPPVPWIAEPLLVGGAVTIMTGREGEGKSMLALALAAAVLSGEDIAGFACREGHVLYVDGENGDAEITRGLHGLGVPDTLHAATGDGFSLSRDLADLERMVRQLAPTLVVLDSLRSLWPGGDENDSGQVEAMIGPLRGLARGCRTAILLLHHLPKSGGNYRGSTALGAAVEIGATLERREGDEDATRRRLRWWKCRPAAEPGPRWLRLVAEQRLVLVEAADPPCDEEPTPRRPSVRRDLAPKVLAAHENGPLTLRELALAIERGPKDGTVRRVRDMLVRNGQLTRHPDGRTQRCHDATVPEPGDIALAPGTLRKSIAGPVCKEDALVTAIREMFPGTVEITASGRAGR